MKLLAYGYVSPGIIAVGVVGDIMSLRVLSHSSLARCAIFRFLYYLAFTDLLSFLSVVPMLLFMIGVRSCDYLAAFYYARLGLPLANAFMASSVWIVVSMTLSQYVAVCYPFHATTFRSRKICRWLLLGSYLLSFVANAPWALKREIRDHFQGQSCSGTNMSTVTIITPARTLMNLNATDIEQFSCRYESCENSDITALLAFKVYEWMRECLARFLPFLLITFFNLRIMSTYRQVKRDRFTCISRSQRVCVSEKTSVEERRLITLLMLITLTFCFCTIPAAFLTVLVRDEAKNSFGFEVFRAVTNILEFTKFALNFYLYCLINPTIRSLCLSILFCQKFEVKSVHRAHSRPIHSPNVDLSDRSDRRSVELLNCDRSVSYFTVANERYAAFSNTNVTT